MAKEAESMILPMLREMRGEIQSLRNDVMDKFAQSDLRFDKLESVVNSIRQAQTADTLLSKLVTGDFEERILELERKVDSLTKGK